MRLSKEQWAEAKQRWENSDISHEALAAEIGVSQQAVSGQAKRNNWARKNVVTDVVNVVNVVVDVVKPEKKTTTEELEPGELTYFNGKPGPGRKPGEPNKVTRTMKLYAAKFGDEAIDRLVEIIRDAEAPHSAIVAAVKELLDRGYGKPKQEVEVSGEVAYVDKAALDARYERNMAKTAELAQKTQERLEELRRGALH